jgi:hypothetical protein
MGSRFARLIVLSALLVAAAWATLHVLSAPTDAAPPANVAHLALHSQASLGPAEVEAAMAGRERPSERPTRSDYDNPERRTRSSSIEALVQRTEPLQD